MRAARRPFQDQENAGLLWPALKLTAVVGLHVMFGAGVFHAKFDVPVKPAPIRLDVRTIDLPAPLPPAATRSVTASSKSSPQSTRPVVHRTEQPSLLAAAPNTDTTSTASVVSPQPAAPPTAETPVATVSRPATVAVTAARYDAAYLQNPAPAFPAMSRKLLEEGTVLLLVHVTATGLAEGAEIKQGSGYPRLDHSALNAVRKWRFVPAYRGDEAVASTVVVPIVFRLDS